MHNPFILNILGSFEAATATKNSQEFCQNATKAASKADKTESSPFSSDLRFSWCGWVIGHDFQDCCSAQMELGDHLLGECLFSRRMSGI